MAERTDTRTRLLDASVRLIAREGLQALSHRSVEREAGTTHGSTSYYFRTRDALLEQVVAYLAERDNQSISELTRDPYFREPRGPSEIATVFAQATERFLDDSRETTLARFELCLYAARKPELQERLTSWRGFLVSHLQRVLHSLDLPHPESGARMFAAMLDGILFTAICVPEMMSHEEIEKQLNAVLTACAYAGSEWDGDVDPLAGNPFG
ncbi:TetR family transcriptional regulator [Streptomyces sp. NPDC005438]|uniref:TetR/AcrR family transcriptional regulator n=1 Tax=Streptomyces sp. NPDC005438 TaxID=3156880 RepID=UPI0033BD1549